MDEKFFDIDSFLVHTGNDRSFARDIANESLRIMPEYLAQIHSALESGNAEQIRKASHKFKGGMRTIFALPAGDTAEHMEKTAASGDVASCLSLRTELDAVTASTIDAIEKYLAAE